MLKFALRLGAAVRSLESRLERIQLALGRIEMAQQAHGVREFQVFSQWGEDGIIASLLASVPVENPVFVEFGVEDYREANTRFLLMSRNWSGLVIDGSAENIENIQKSDLSWRYDLDARNAFVTRENIDSLLRDAGVTGDIGLLSIDIDGNDYWVWEAISVVQPRIVVVEYNSLFGSERAVTVPYDRAFVRTKKHHSNLYYGASIAALARLGEKKGYALAAGNSAGNNAFFVRRDLLGSLPARTPAQVYRRARFREARDARGHLTFGRFEARLAEIRHLPVRDVETEREVAIETLGVV